MSEIEIVRDDDVLPVDTYQTPDADDSELIDWHKEHGHEPKKADND